MSARTSSRPATDAPVAAPPHLIDPGPLATKEGFAARARRIVVAPSLDDSAPGAVQLNDPRVVYHGDMPPLETDDYSRGLYMAKKLLVRNLFETPGRSPNFAVDGPRLAGKSLLAAQIGFAFQGLVDQAYPPDEDRHPVAYIHVPHDRSDAMQWSLPFAQYWGLEHSRSPETLNHRPVDMTGPITRVMRRAGTRLVIIDGIEYIKDNERQTAFDYLFHLQDELPKITFLFCGIGAQQILEHALGDHRSHAPAASRDKPGLVNIAPLWVRPVPYTAAEPDQWYTLLNDAEAHLRLRNHQPGTLLDLAAYLHERTDGSMHAVNQLLSMAAQSSILDGSEAIDRNLLDSIYTGYNDPAYERLPCLPALTEATAHEDNEAHDQAVWPQPEDGTPCRSV